MPEVNKRIVNCQFCGGNLTKINDVTATCSYCGKTTQIDFKLDDRTRIDLNMANSERNLGNFDRAILLYDSVIEEHPACFEAYWGAFLSRYGIVYVKDNDSGKMVPTCQIINSQDVSDNTYYKKAMEFCEIDRKAETRASAEEINAVTKRIVELSKKAPKYDIFISFKHTEADDKNRVTRDYEMAQNLYNHLISMGRKVFFSPVSLNEYDVKDYEAHIYSALHSATLMFVVAHDDRYINSPWVKNEWSRFMTLCENNVAKSCKVVYKTLDPGNLPQKLSKLQNFKADENLFKKVDDFVKQYFKPNKFDGWTEEQLAEYHEKKRKRRLRITGVFASLLLIVGAGAGIYFNASTKAANVDIVIEKTAQLEITADSTTAVNTMVDAYEDLSSWQKTLVVSNTQYSSIVNTYETKVAEAEAETARLQAEAEAEAARVQAELEAQEEESYNLEKAQSVETIIERVALETLSLNSESTVESMVSSFDALTTTQQNMVSNYETYKSIVDSFNLLKAQEVDSMYSKISKLMSGTYSDFEDIITAYEALSTSQKEVLTCEDDYLTDKQLYDVTTAIKAVVADPTNETLITKAQNLYDVLDSSLQERVWNYSSLDSARTSIIMLASLSFTLQDDGTYKVAANTSSMPSGEIVIPTMYEGKYVTAVGSFQNCTSLTSIEVPSTVQNIDSAAFAGCTSLTEMTLPFTGISNSATAEDAVFGAIFDVTINSSTSYKSNPGSTIWQYNNGSFASSDCWFHIPTTIQKITISSANIIPENAFINCSFLTTVIIESGSSIGDSAFKDCTNISQLEVPSSAKSIGDEAFSGCQSLISINISDATTVIGEYAFNNCYSLSTFNSVKSGEFIVPSSVIALGEGVFTGCNKMKYLTIPFVGTSKSGSEEYGIFGIIFEKTIDSSTSFTNNPGDAIWQFDDGSFGTSDYWIYFPSLYTVTVTNATNISTNAFYNCDFLTSITIYGYNDLTIGTDAFYNCSATIYDEYGNVVG